MKCLRQNLVSLFLLLLLAPLFAGCGGNSGGETMAAPPMTGDTTLFPNAQLMSTPADIATSQPLVLDARTTNEFNVGHIPGAISAPTNMFEDSEGRLLDDAALAVQLGKLGLTPTSAIVIYDNATPNDSAAGRLFWILKYMGCTNVRILNGGWQQWLEYYAGTTEPTVPLQETNFPNLPDTTVKTAEKAEVAAHFLDGIESGFVLIDVRTVEEYEAGHIPGAINFPYKNCFNADRTILNFQDLKHLLATYGVATDKEMVVYSNKNHRGGFFYFLCQLMGYANVTVYLGSIEDWTAENPLGYTLVTGKTQY